MMGTTNIPISKPCTFHDLISPSFQHWKKEMKLKDRIHRKDWEFCFIANSLFETGMLKEGAKGLGFGCGQEPLPALFVKYGCEILATDLDYEKAKDSSWVESGEHSSTIDQLYKEEVCERKLFYNKCRFRPIDMTDIPDDLGQYDFIWSSCALEHLGSIAKGKKFIYNAMKCLKSTGVAVHTTEYNITSNLITIDTYPKWNTCILRKKDIEDIARNLSKNGCDVQLCFELGNHPYDKFIDSPPYKLDPHLRLRIGTRYNPLVATSYGLVIRKH